VAVYLRRLPTPTLRNYREGKPLLREDFRLECCYCGLREGEFGGWRNFHVEHYQPKWKFPGRVNDYTNLLYSCSTCNLLKGASWYPGDPLQETEGFLDPCVHDLATLFEPEGDGRVNGKIASAKFMVEKLDLNRFHLVQLRSLRTFLNGTINTCKAAEQRAIELSATNGGDKELPLMATAFGVIGAMAEFYLAHLSAPPYPYPS
jgi:hypothetical protein